MSVTAASAFRADLATRTGPFGADDDAWLAVASLLQYAAPTSSEARAELLEDAIELAQQIIGAANLKRRAEREWQDVDRSPCEVVLLLADDMHLSGALNLAAAMLDALPGADPSLTELQIGRVLIGRARIAWKLGYLDEATERTRHVEGIARRMRSAELRTLTSLSYCTIAQLRGNFPEMDRHAARAARLAAHNGLIKLAREARNAQMIAAGMAGRMEEALSHGWRVYEASRGNVVDEAETLQNIGQVLLDAGRAPAAIGAFRAVVSLALPARVMLPALGGLARAAAIVGDERVAQWAASEVERTTPAAEPRWSLAVALIESAEALAHIRRPRDAERLRVRALELGRVHGFHEVVFRAESLAESAPAFDVARQQFGERGAAVERHIAALSPEHLPDHVTLAAALS